MRVTYFGHACFEFAAEGFPTLLLDPYRPDGLDGRFSLPPIRSNPDIIGMTHYHEDHSWILPEWKGAAIVDGECESSGISFRAIPTYHDTQLGTQMGLSIALAFQYGDFQCIHLGDMGASPTPEIRQKLGSPDVLLVPMGDTYTMGPREAVKAARELSGGWVIPMHGADPRIDLPLAPISDFVDAWQGPIVQPEESYRATLKNKASTPTLLNMRAMGI